MRILLLNQTFYPDPVATAQQLTDLAEYLVARGCEVTVVCDQRGYDRRDRLYPREEIHKGIRILRVPSTGLGKKSFFHRIVDFLSFDLSLLWRLARLRRHDVVVSLTSPPLIGFIGAWLAVLWRAKSIQWLMDINPDAAIAVGYLKRRSPVSWALTRCLEFSLRRSAAAVVLDRWMQKRVEAHGMEASRIRIVSPWPVVDFDLRGLPRQNRFRTEHGLDGKFVILYSGNHSVVHPLDTLLETARRMRDERDVVFCFIGGGVRVAEVTRYKETHGLDNIVQIGHQPRERLRESLTFADMHAVVLGEKVNGLVHLSKIYGVLASGRPFLFVGPAESHVGDLLRECPSGFRADHGDPEAAAAHIRRVRAMGAEALAALERKSLEYVERHYRGDKSKGYFLTEVLGVKPSASGEGAARHAV